MIQFIQHGYCYAIATCVGVLLAFFGMANGNTSGLYAQEQFAGPVKIVGLLWNANPKSSAETLAKIIQTALDRESVQELNQAFIGIRDKLENSVSSSNYNDPRYLPALCALALIESDKWHRELHDALETLTRRSANDVNQIPLGGLELVARVSLARDSSSAESLIQYVVSNQSNLAAASRLLQILLSDCESATHLVLGIWPNLPPTLQAEAIEPMTQNAGRMQELLAAVGQGKVKPDLFNTNQLRKWIQAGNAPITKQIEKIWGTIREQDNAQRQLLVSSMLERIKNGSKGSVGRGVIVFERVCSQCHVLHGKGFEVGPNITNNGRGNLDQLVSNMLDPSLVIGPAFQAKLVLTLDGEVIAGLLADETETRLKLKVQGGKIIELDKVDIEQINTSVKSLMPEGLEAQLSEQEFLDLISYLCLVKAPEAEDNELIQGTPADFVQP